MMTNKPEKLWKKDASSESTPQYDDKAFNISKSKINNICVSVSKASNEYDPQMTMISIKEYLDSNKNFERFLYSELSNYIYSLDISKRGTLATNIEKLLLYALKSSNGVDGDTKKLVIKLYDHFQLALHQIENAKNIASNNIENAKVDLTNEVKSMQKEYITILGIFASIVLTFVGGISFSSSILENIAEVSPFRLILVIDFLGFILTNTIYLLLKFILIINNSKAEFSVKWINCICLVIAIVTLGVWILNKCNCISI